MAELRDRIDITVEELEESLGARNLPKFIEESEKSFLERIDTICNAICKDREKKAIFVSGPTSSGKTTFTLRLAKTITAAGRKACHLSLDDYYNLKEIVYDREGRPDFETIDALDVERIQSDIAKIINGETVIPPFFDFQTRTQQEGKPENAITLGEDGVLVVEGLHGLNKRISGDFKDTSAKVFIMPYGNVYCDTKLMDSNEIRMLRRIVRDNRHRNAHAIATIDYWPMISRSEDKYYTEYLTEADYHVNSFLAYESLIIAPLALSDIQSALKKVEKGTIEPSVFMEKSNTSKPFADLSAALTKASKLIGHLDKIPVVSPEQVPAESILNEFISG
ncbi:MAG: hypothetical protein IKH23_10130 [Clostridiales bacterium]|nr:hypothetical protein [Clostridiales bacterium]